MKMLKDVLVDFDREMSRYMAGITWRGGVQ